MTLSSDADAADERSSVDGQLPPTERCATGHGREPEEGTFLGLTADERRAGFIVISFLLFQEVDSNVFRGLLACSIAAYTVKQYVGWYRSCQP
ncbi:uncharacterized protein TEOVI_000610400 [Trypanosoma equiperdum]|uniref:Uncharacterized protein n=1 Tax=Trypanosoma equiperdum TaxID=5694 RepID=A0A1G4I744_TRYEQ|nr:hypothetical protein, conserved [Trypanosoma equiperdum]